MALLTPTLKVAPFSIVPVIRKPEFGPNQVDKLVVDDNTAIVIHRMMSHRPTVIMIPAVILHSDIQKNILAVRMGNNTTQHFPGMDVCVIFKEMIKASVTPGNCQFTCNCDVRNFEFRAGAESSTLRFCDLNASNNPFGVSFKVHCPLVELAGRVNTQTPEALPWRQCNIPAHDLEDAILSK